ncbi:hypothetical protein PRUPE_3G176800 [Prunus persica]|uniref:Uncharacterized protein n=1 Tax=Prunus persica TaxID=3760 RepID=A0A251Q1R2_PRUPE|nr:hypothetical protein PRUPE_3G176800 [Prunus persica]
MKPTSLFLFLLPHHHHRLILASKPLQLVGPLFSLSLLMKMVFGFSPRQGSGQYDLGYQYTHVLFQITTTLCRLRVIVLGVRPVVINKKVA